MKKVHAIPNTVKVGGDIDDFLLEDACARFVFAIGVWLPVGWSE